MWLRQEQKVTIDDLAARLNVSIMTIHRDLDALAKAGQVEKVRGGAVMTNRGKHGETTRQCTMCATHIPVRTTFIINTTTSGQLHACCPHCGLLLLDKHPDVVSVLARDFLYGRMVNAGDAYFLLNSDVAACCEPSVLCFANERDASRFRQGFGGDVLDYGGARDYLRGRHGDMHHAG